MQLIVIDTNVLISAGLLPNSKAAQSLTAAFDHFVLAQNQMTWSELQEKISLLKFDKYFGIDGRLRLMARLTQNIEFVDVQAIVTDCRDPRDNKFLALATTRRWDLLAVLREGGSMTIADLPDASNEITKTCMVMWKN